MSKIEWFVENITTQWKDLYYPNQDLTVDESIIGYRGRCRYLQYNPNKPVKYGLKYFSLSKSDGYMLDLYLYQGKSVKLKEPLTLHVIKRLLSE